MRKLKFYLYRYRKELRIAIDNQTKFHVGRIEFEIDFRSHRTQAYTAAVWRLVDLPPGGVRTSVVGADDVSSIHCNDFFEIRGAEAITVTGIVPGEAK